MPRLPARTAADVVRVLKKHGFYFKRQAGSHAIYQHSDGRRTTVPMHGKHDLGRGLLHQILKDAGLDVEDL